MVAIAKVVFTSREHMIALEPRDKGMMAVTLRYPYEVRKPNEYFSEISDEKVPKDMLELATHIVETKRGRFEPDKFEDEYEGALKDLLRKKQKGEKIEQPKGREPSNVINLMDALRNSVKGENGQGSRPAKKSRKRVDGQREMLFPIAGKKGKEAPVKRAARPHARRKSAG
jgi:DNA end-binding protein Ku